LQKYLINIITRIILNIILWGWIVSPFATSVLAQESTTADSTLLQSPVIAKEKSNLKLKSPVKAMIYSALIPGLGQLYNGKKFKALVIFSAECGLIANSIYLNQQYKKSVFDYDKEFYLNNRNLSTWYLVGAVLFSVLDAFVDAHLYHFDESEDLSFNLNATRAKDVVFSLVINFKK